MGAVALPVLSKSRGGSASKDRFIFLCKWSLFLMPKSTTQRRGQLTEKRRNNSTRSLLAFRNPPVIEAVFSPSHCSQRPLDGVPSLPPAWQGLSITPQIAASFLGKLHALLSSCPPSSCPTIPLSPAPAAATRVILLSPWPARRCHEFNGSHAGSWSFQSSFPPSRALPAPAHICNCQSILHPPSELGPLGLRHGAEACEDMVSCLGEIPSPETRACRAKHSCRWHWEPWEARL